MKAWRDPSPVCDDGLARADLREMGARLLRRQRCETVVLGRNVEHADAGAVLRRRQHDAVLGRLARGAVDPRGRLAGVPHFVEQRTDARRRCAATRGGGPSSWMMACPASLWPVTMRRNGALHSLLLRPIRSRPDRHAERRGRPRRTRRAAGRHGPARQATRPPSVSANQSAI